MGAIVLCAGEKIVGISTPEILEVVRDVRVHPFQNRQNEVELALQHGLHLVCSGRRLKRVDGVRAPLRVFVRRRRREDGRNLRRQLLGCLIAPQFRNLFTPLHDIFGIV